ncbi:MAG: T9SS type A sorting domain-containing protein [Saprospiraceae bacterium]|nr:T9SS type A sorting domain-containing protein [Saprospiraceae bacterium]
MKIFPNPTNNAIQITGNPSINNKNFTITDILGKTVKSGKINNPDDKIDLSDFNSGAYYLKIEDYLNAFKIIKID